MKNFLLKALHDYLLIFPEEQARQLRFLSYLQSHNDEEIIDWNNFDGHVVAGGFIYAKSEKKFLVLYHKDLKMFLYPGGHINNDDSTPLSASRREVKEETGLDNLEQLNISENELTPIDVDTHVIGYNERLHLPEHYHFEFRYLFTIDKISDIKVDAEELSNYKWIDMEELSNDPNYGKIAVKIQKFLYGSKAVEGEPKKL